MHGGGMPVDPEEIFRFAPARPLPPRFGSPGRENPQLSSRGIGVSRDAGAASHRGRHITAERLLSGGQPRATTGGHKHCPAHH